LTELSLLIFVVYNLLTKHLSFS